MSEIKAVPTREGYDMWAGGYDTYDNALIALEAPIVDRLVGKPTGLRIADIGCGTGRRALQLAPKNTVFAIDFSIGMLDQLRAKASEQQLSPRQLHVIEHDLSKGIPLPERCFDLVLCSLVLEHLSNLDMMMRQLARICAAEGHVIISDFHPEMVRRGYHARFRSEPGGDKFQIAGAYHPVSDYVTGALNAGLKIAHISEHLMDEQTVEHSQSAQKWVGLPFLLVLDLVASIG